MSSQPFGCFSVIRTASSVAGIKGGSVVGMARLDILGNRHKELLEQLEQLREDLAEAIRDARANEEPTPTLVDLMIRSGYRSMDAIRGILEPEFKLNRRRRRAVRKIEEDEPNGGTAA